MNFTTQIHDFDPGFGHRVDAQGDRVFWTVPIPEDDVSVHFGAGSAQLDVDHLHLRDYGSIPNALGPIATSSYDPATVSFDVSWTGPVTRDVHVHHGTLGDVFSAVSKEDQATVTWSGRNRATGFRFTSDPGDSSTSVDFFAQIAHVRSGIFARDGDPGPGPAPGPGSNNGLDQAFAALALAAGNGASAPLVPGLAVGHAPQANLDAGLSGAVFLQSRNPRPDSADHAADISAAGATAADDRVFAVGAALEAMSLDAGFVLFR